MGKPKHPSLSLLTKEKTCQEKATNGKQGAQQGCLSEWRLRTSIGVSQPMRR